MHIEGNETGWKKNEGMLYVIESDMLLLKHDKCWRKRCNLKDY